jgi:hypothetical protein
MALFGPMPMSQEHKEALAEGRRESRAIKAYLKALQGRKPGRPVTRESLEKRLASVNARIESSDDPLESVELIQKRLDLEEALVGADDAASIDDLEAGFVAHARSYSERKNISYTAWREFGVPAATVRAAGIRETRRR